MSTRQTLKRIARLEKLMRPPDDGDGTISVTLEQLCRESWEADKEGFKKMAKNSLYQIFVHRFQAAEDAEVASIALRRLNARR
jgi:ABC-type xylose transport system substrate-binding protein